MSLKPVAPAYSRAASSRSLQEMEKAKASFKSRGKYDADADLAGDIGLCKLALQLFLESKMVESETLLREGDQTFERLYIGTGYSLIECVKALMSFEDKDLSSAIELTKQAAALATKHRKTFSLTSRVAGFVIGSDHVATLKAMTPVQRHAELIYAECLAEKALLGIVYSGDWLQFIKEAINMRTSINIYRNLLAYLDAIDAEAVSQGKGPIDTSVDNDFRSGVLLGMGVVHLVLSLLPGRIVPIFEVFGYKGDRATALSLLGRAGGWTTADDPDQPKVPQSQEGVRRSLCDIVILIFHLVLSGFTFNGVDLHMAERVLDWNLKRYPDGVFFLFGQGRLQLFHAQAREAIRSYERAIEVQSQYRQLHFISLWEVALANFALWEIGESLACWRQLAEEATWSKAVYTYGLAACLVQLGGEDKMKEAGVLLSKVSSLMQRIAGKSIPLEKFVSRRAQKFTAQGNRLLLPALELSWIFLAVARAQPDDILAKMIPPIEDALAVLQKHEADPTQYCSEPSTAGAKVTDNGYWDDYCLAKFLLGVCLRYVVFPDPYAILEEKARDTDGLAEKAKAAFLSVIENGPKIKWDHHLVYNAHYELGRLEARMGNEPEARKHIELVLSGKPLEVNAAGKKGKYNLENALMLRAHAAIEALDQGKQL